MGPLESICIEPLTRTQQIVLGPYLSHYADTGSLPFKCPRGGEGVADKISPVEGFEKQTPHILLVKRVVTDGRESHRPWAPGRKYPVCIVPVKSD